ncbi:MAG: oxidoreductase [Micrococcales bacterium 70-64]|nr:NAD(P)-dependent oxidoreductase [Leifsonia sp.]ODU64294.1 MAG: oxidoreductase [Leifsonia sp. SCN 70-46]OJX85985.1 MAG: oxidoreductase [Micrococcales bacterium 70-64]
MARVGFLGMGNMGGAMAGRLLESGHEVVVWNRTPEACDDLVARGAVRVETAREALAEAVSFSMFANDEASEAVLSADNLAGSAGRMHVNTASISAAAADRIAAVHAAAGVGYLASPVLGRPAVAAAGNLNLLVAGPDDLVEAAAPYLSVLGARTWRFGTEPRRANAVKIAVNFTILHALQAMAEGITLVEAQDVDAVDFVELLAGTLFGGVVYSGYGSMIAERRYSPPGFSMPLGLKDLGLAEDLAAETGTVLPTAPVLRDRFEQALANPELAELDWSAVAEVTRER